MTDKSIKPPILVTGSHRSGSTWVGKVLASAKGTGYMHEPFNPIYPTPNRSPLKVWYHYVSQHNHDTYFQFFRDTLNWDYQSGLRFAAINSAYKAKMWLKYSGIFLKNKGSRPIMKDPIAMFSAPWLHEQFNMPVVILIRHPAAFAYSLKRKDWGFPFEHLQRQKQLLNDWLVDFESEIDEFTNSKKDIIEQACLVWRILYATVNKFQEKYPQWIYLRHEDLSLNPLEEFKGLFNKLDLEFDHKVEQYIIESSGAENPAGTTGNEEQLQRNSAANIKYWRNKLSQEELDRIKELTQDIWPAFYCEADW